jgi:hypothetical protein
MNGFLIRVLAGSGQLSDEPIDLVKGQIPQVTGQGLCKSEPAPRRNRPQQLKLAST